MHDYDYTLMRTQSNTQKYTTTCCTLCLLPLGCCCKQGEPSARTTRIFVARIPPSVSEAQFKGYFEGFGKLQDAYMPRDHAKQVKKWIHTFCLYLESV